MYVAVVNHADGVGAYKSVKAIRRTQTRSQEATLSKLHHSVN